MPSVFHVGKPARDTAPTPENAASSPANNQVGEMQTRNLPSPDEEDVHSKSESFGSEGRDRRVRLTIGGFMSGRLLETLPIRRPAEALDRPPRPVAVIQEPGSLGS